LSSNVKRRFLKLLIAYFATLITLQLTIITCVIRWRGLGLQHVVPLAIFLGTILPIILGLLFIKIFKIS
jgi:hypothetical protein